jgi:Xaa-Pro aminopeptidase
MADQLSISEISLEERERRYGLLRERLKSAGLSALLVYGGTQLGVPIHYLTGIWGNKNNLVLFPAEGEPVFVAPTNSGLSAEGLARQGCWITADHIHFAPHPVIEAATLIKGLKLERTRIGIDSLLFWPVVEYQTLGELCPGVQLVEAHRLFGEIRGPKSPEEMRLIEKAMRISDMAHFAFLARLKHGLTELEAAAPAIEVLDTHGVGDRIVLIHSRPEAVYATRPGKSLVLKPNPVTFSPEFSRNAGYGAQMIRAYWWEEPQGIYKKMFGLWAEMRQMVLQEFRPGVEITAAGQKIEDLVKQFGFECDKLGHGVGISYGDAPYITAGPHEKDYMPWTIQAGEVYAVHPMVRCQGYKAPWSMIGDMYHVEKERTTWMTTALPGLPEMIPE